MSKRIQELAEKAGFYINEDGIFVPTTDENVTQITTKFAELIVKECAEICLEANDHRNILRCFGVER